MILIVWIMTALAYQPLVENAVKHGISPKKEGGFIRISAERGERFLILRVIDTGNGLYEERRKTYKIGETALSLSGSF